MKDNRSKLKINLLHSLRGHEAFVIRMSISPDGQKLASPSDDKTVRIWNIKNGKLLNTLKAHNRSVVSVAWSPDNKYIASGGDYGDEKIIVWDAISGRAIKTLTGHTHAINSIAWSPNGRLIASASTDRTIRVWDFYKGSVIKLLANHSNHIEEVIWLPGESIICSCSWDSTIRLTNYKDAKDIQILTGHKSKINSISVSPDSSMVASGSSDRTIRIWNLNNGRQTNILEGHTDTIVSVSFFDNGKRIASLSENGILIIWRTDNWIEEYRINDIGARGWFAKLAFHPFSPIMAVRGKNWNDINIWNLKFESIHVQENTTTKNDIIKNQITPISQINNDQINKKDNKIIKDKGTISPTESKRSTINKNPSIPKIEDEKSGNSITHEEIISHREPYGSSIRYINAKIVLLGDTGVGKSGLGIRIAENRFRKTESTHGAQFWQIPVPNDIIKKDINSNMQAEITLWDLAGQPEYRLIHQLFIDDTDAALLLFDCSDAADPFRGILYWGKVLKKHAPSHSLKLLIASRCDVSPVTVDQNQIDQIINKFNLNCFFHTSAKSGDGIENLIKYLTHNIQWENLPQTTTPKLFHSIRQILMELKENGDIIISADRIKQEIELKYKNKPNNEEIGTVILLLQSRGFIYLLYTDTDSNDSNSSMILLKPELINQYASSIIQSARNHPLGIGAVPEREVIIAAIPFTGVDRLIPSQEKIILESSVKILIKHDLCFREMGYLVFPSQINIAQPKIKDSNSKRCEIAYRFSGSIETIYASLVVRLSHTNYFQRETQWKYAVEFSRDGFRLGFKMKTVEEGTGEVEIYFDNEIDEFDRVTFIRFITDHLRNKGIDIKEQLRLYCPKCDEEIRDVKAISKRIKAGKIDIICQFCDNSVMIPTSIEERYISNRKLIKKQHELGQLVERRTEIEIKEFNSDQTTYTKESDNNIHILHISDMHIKNIDQVIKYRLQIETDLINELNIKKLEYLIISGDIADNSIEDEYIAAFDLVNGLVKRFGLDSSRVVIVPGNHDLNWDLSEKSYVFIPKRKLSSTYEKDKFISAGEAGGLIRDDSLYKNRFNTFSKYFYKKIYINQEYPKSYDDQAIIHEHPQDKILFLALNSSWQIDHHFKKRASINMNSLSKSLNCIQNEKYKDWVKMCVWHHPIFGREMMNDEFMQLLSIHGFKVCLHGHIHESIEGFYNYDAKRKIHVIGGGTFGAPTNEQIPGIPLQYNLLSFDSSENEFTVYTRKKDKPNGAWAADSRWGDKNDPKPFYTFTI